MGNLDHVHVTCCQEGCSAIITFHRQEYKRLIETHEFFCCPYQHSQHFAGESELEKLRREVERLSGRPSQYEYGRLEDVAKALEAGVLVCPFGCGWKSRRNFRDWSWYAATRFLDRVGRDMAEHLQEAHGARVKDQKLLTAGS